MNHGTLGRPSVAPPDCSATTVATARGEGQRVTPLEPAASYFRLRRRIEQIAEDFERGSVDMRACAERLRAALRATA